MFYVKEKTDEIEVKVELNSENVFCACPDCGKEVAVDLSCVFADGLGQGYIEEGSNGFKIPNYAYDYIMKFIKSYKG